MSLVELRLTEVDPPAPDPPRTIYTDLVNLPDPAVLGLTCRLFNLDSVGLYMRVDAYAAGWTFTTNDLGLLASGANMYRNLDNFGSRAKPATELTETITLRLRAYTDAGYTTLKWTFERVVTVVFVNSADPSYTQDVLNNFDDGTVQGWAIKEISHTGTGPIISCAVANDYFLSAPYSLKGVAWYSTAWRPETLVINYIEVSRNGTPLIHLGKTLAAELVDDVPLAKWMRLVVPLPRNTAIELRLVWAIYFSAGGNYWRAVVCLYKSFVTPDKDTAYAIMDIRVNKLDGWVYDYYSWMWLDDFKIISK